MLETKNRTLRHVIVDVLGVDTCQPNFHPQHSGKPGSEIVKHKQRCIHFFCFFNRVLCNIVKAEDTMSREGAFLGFCLENDVPTKLSAIYCCLRSSPNLISNTCSLPPLDNQAEATVVRNGNDEDGHAVLPPQKRPRIDNSHESN